MNNIKIQEKLILLLMLATPIFVLCQDTSSRIKNGYAKFKEELYPTPSIKSDYAKFKEELYATSSIKNGYAKFEEELYSIQRKECDYSKFEEEFYASSKAMVEEAISFNSIKISSFDKYTNQFELKAAIAKMLKNSNVNNEKTVIIILLDNANEPILVPGKVKESTGFAHEELKYKY